MTRFKEPRRIERALLHRDVEQLRLADGCCQMRLSLARGSGIKDRQKLQREVQHALRSIDERPS